MLTKEEYENALDIIEEGTTEYEDSCSIPRTSYNEFEEQIRILRQLIKEYFDPQPYKFEELEDGMWIWDDKLEICDQVILTRVCLDPKTEKTCKPFYVVTYAGEIEYEENRFFPITKAYQEKE